MRRFLPVLIFTFLTVTSYAQERLGPTIFVGGNHSDTLEASAYKTAADTSSDAFNIGCRGGHFYLDVTDTILTPSIVLVIEGKDEVSGKYYTVLQGAAVTGEGLNVYKVYPGLTASANAVANDILPRTFRTRVTHADGDSVKHTVSYTLIR